MKVNSTFARAIILMLIVQQVAAQQLIEGYGSKIMGTPYHAITSDMEGNVFVYYHFDRVNSEYVGSLAKLDETGQLFAGFHKVYTDGVIGDVQFQTDGKILISGDYTQINGQPCSGLARLHPDGSVDMSFTSAIERVGAFRLQSDGKIVAFASSGLVRFNTDGSLDQSFSSISINSKGVLDIGADDYIHVLAQSTVYRLKPNGEVDPDFYIGTGVNESISAIEVQSDGKVLLGGFFTEYNGTPAPSIVRILPDGQVDPSFDVGTGTQGQIFQIVERPNKKILLGGQFTHYNNQQASLVQLTSDGNLDRIIAIVMMNNITYIADSPDQKVTIAGEFSVVNGQERKYIVQFNPDHTINTGFNPIISYTNANERFLELNSKGEVLTGGFDGIFNGSSGVKQLLVKLDVFGRYVSSFSPSFPGQNPWIRSSCIQDDDKILLGGFLQGHSGPTLTRLNSDGSIDESFQVGSGLTVGVNSPFSPDVIVKKDSLLYVGGSFEKYNGHTAKSLVAIKLDGSVHKTFPALPGSSQVIDIAFQSDGKVILFGSFDLPSGRKAVIRLNTDGSIDDNFSIDLNGNLQFVRTDDNDRIYLGGMIHSVNGALVSSLVRLLPNGDIDAAFDTGSGFSDSDHVIALELLPNGNLAVGGWFSTYQNEEVNGFVILDQYGTRLPTPLMHFGANSFTTDIKYGNGALYLAGRFVKDDYSDVYGNIKVALEPPVAPTAPQDLTVDLHAEGIFQLQWTDQSNNELLFILERSIESVSAFIAYDTLYANTVKVLDSNIEPQKKYFYRLKAVNEAGESSWSNIASHLWLPPPGGEVSLTVTRQGDDEFLLSWESSVTNHAGYIIERAENTSLGYFVLDTVSAEMNTYVDIVEKEKTYAYKVGAYNAAGRVISNEVSSIISALVNNEAVMSLYPVPAKHTVYARIEALPAQGQWKLLNTNGQSILLPSERFGETTAVDIQNVPPGLYTVQFVERGRVMITSRIIIER